MHCAFRTLILFQPPGEEAGAHGELADIAVELAREAEAARDARQTRAHQVVQVAVRRRRQLKRAEANVVQGPPHVF